MATHEHIIRGSLASVRHYELRQTRWQKNTQFYMFFTRSDFLLLGLRDKGGPQLEERPSVMVLFNKKCEAKRYRSQDLPCTRFTWWLQTDWGLRCKQQYQKRLPMSLRRSNHHFSDYATFWKFPPVIRSNHIWTLHHGTCHIFPRTSVVVCSYRLSHPCNSTFAEQTVITCFFRQTSRNFSVCQCSSILYLLHIIVKNAICAGVKAAWEIESCCFPFFFWSLKPKPLFGDILLKRGEQDYLHSLFCFFLPIPKSKFKFHGVQRLGRPNAPLMDGILLLCTVWLNYTTHWSQLFQKQERKKHTKIRRHCNQVQCFS